MKEIIVGRKGNQQTAINDLSVSKEHCKIIVNDNGTFTIENLSGNGTKVDGRNVVKASVNLNSRIQLGPTFSATLGELIGNQLKSQGAHSGDGKIGSQSVQQKQPETKVFNISHLREVWNEYNQVNIAMADQQRKTNLTRTGLGIFTMCAMPTIFFFGPVGYVLTGIGVLGNIYSFAGMRNSETAEERQERQDAFDEAWVCPNPDCGRPLPAKNYKMLVRHHHYCPYCKCKYVER